MNKPSKPPVESPEQRDSDLVQVVDRTALIENILNQIIVGYCAPRKEAWEFMWSVVLDTSVMSLGSKIKVAMAAAHEMRFKLNKDALHRVISLRNAFAHHASNAHPVLVVGREPEDDSSHLQLWVLESSGKITKMKREEALTEFNKVYKAAKESIVELKNAIHAKYEQSAA
ncbi:MAG: hypothetical protein A2514_13480 [Gammaproteobacteria bacterium RIFOXYD12_FULL_61_37]|nr:MAG: hypothetical protein A2514_13480 [Gammaproteobacteria bacterium RIFOXYD12_FULL_61_37]